MSLLTQLRPTQAEPPQRRDRRRMVLIVATAVVGLALVMTWLVAFSPVFGVRTVDVRGLHVLTPEQVRAAANIKHGTPLVRLDTAAVTRRVEKLPDVASAQVSTSFPSTVVISVEERVPVGYLWRAGHTWLVDATGLPYRTVRAAPPGLPRFRVPSGSTGHAAAQAVAAVAAALPARVRHQVSSVEALDPGAITLVLSHGRVVQWGSADRTAEKARLLPVLLRHHPTTVDLTNPDQPFTR